MKSPVRAPWASPYAQRRRRSLEQRSTDTSRNVADLAASS